jgi:RND family efflux transporter MFP subunit
MKKKIIIGVIAFLFLGGGWYYFSRDETTTEQTETVRRDDVVEMISVTGALVPTHFVDVAFRNAGIIDALFVHEGEQISSGEKIASLDRSVLWSQLKEARLAASIVEQTEKLARHGWDDLKQEEKNAKRLASEQAREAVRTLEARMQESILFSPMDGMITRLDMNVGETATPSTVIAHIIKADTMVVEARVPESDITKIKVGMQSIITFDALYADEVFDADIVHIDLAPTIVQDVVSYEVTFRLRTIDERLKEGMTANIDIETNKREAVLTVPFRVLTKENGKTYATVKQADGTFVKTEVIVGLEGDNGTIEIKSGLQEGDVVTLGTAQKK